MSIAAHTRAAGGFLWPLAGTAALLGGCLSAPLPENAATPWTPTERARAAEDARPAVRAQAPDLSKPLTLAEMADIALQNNPASAKAWCDARAAAEQAKAARSYLMPTITGTANVHRQRTTATPDMFDQDNWRYGPGLQMNYLILNFGGGTGAAVEQALQTVYAADYAFNRAIQDVLLAVESAYYGLLSAQAGVEAAEANVADAQAALDAAQTRNQAGVGTDLDVLQAQAGYDQARYGRASAQGLCKIARGALALTLGLPADAVVQPAPPSADVPQAIAEPDMRKMIDDAIARRPDVAALRAGVKAAQAAVRVAGAEIWPSLYLTGAVNRDYGKNLLEQGTAGGGPSLGGVAERDWSYGAGLSLEWTLFDGLRTRSARRAAIAEMESAQAQLRQAELAAGGDVWTRYQNYASALEKYTFSDAYLKSASAAYDLALGAYKAGLRSVLDLLNAETQRAQARSQRVAARQEVFTALANLAHAAGLLDKGGAARAQAILSAPPQTETKP